MRWAAVLLLGGCVCASAEEPPIGLLTLPEVFGFRDTCNIRSGAQVLVYQNPGGAILGRIVAVDVPAVKANGRCGAASALFRPTQGQPYSFYPLREFRAGIPAVLAQEERGAWVRIAVAGGSGWVRNVEPRRLFSLLELLRRNEPRLTGEWNEVVYESPAGPAVRLDILEREKEDDALPDIRIQVLEQICVAGKVWLHLIFLSKPPEQGKTLIQRREGWIVAHGRNGMPALWFSPAGR